MPADYVGRTGYDPAFVGPKSRCRSSKNTRDVLTFPWKGRQESVLKYQHFSVVMSRSRRLCIFSAVNIDGSTPRRFKRPSWRLDGRIPTSQQIREECYGNEPLFARGHMTRREDPIWGTPAEAALGNDDSMHVTNTVPQMQPFNAGIWLALESYALENARDDHMRISVFTGPFLLADDPVREGVRIPRSFWKVIAFIHDETRKLCATGYTMSQEDFLRDEEFVFGQHKTSQTRIAAIEKRAGLSFGRLAALDPFEGDERGRGGAVDRSVADQICPASMNGVRIVFREGVMAKRAFLVGINRYQIAGADLRGCVNDVKDLSAALVEFHGFKKGDITVLTDAGRDEESHAGRHQGAGARFEEGRRGAAALFRPRIARARRQRRRGRRPRRDPVSDRSRLGRSAPGRLAANDARRPARGRQPHGHHGLLPFRDQHARHPAARCAGERAVSPESLDLEGR